VEGPETLYRHPENPQLLYAIYGRDKPPYLHFSPDGGASWEPAVGMGSISDARLFFDHQDGQRIYLIGDLDFFRSDDTGWTWRECGRPDAWSARGPSRLLVDPRDPDRLLMATRGAGILVSTDGCGGWEASNQGLKSMFVNTLAMDPSSPDTLYAGTDSGAYVSFDAGKSWGEINDGLLGATVVYSIVVDKDSNVYAATPYGIFTLEGK
jgi:photosystem II stability/assembly factor-like uncharacterized protein